MPDVLTAPMTTPDRSGPQEAPAPGLHKALKILFAFLLLAASGCSDIEAKTSYHPILVPVKLEWSPSGLKVSGESSFITPIGVFAVGADHPFPEKDPDSVYVIIRDAKGSPDNPDSQGFDRIYKLEGRSSRLTTVVNGTSSFQVSDRQILIDVTAGNVQTIEFKEAQTTVRERTAGPLDKWNAYWGSSFYAPFALSRWAYDDSTISNWSGIGFLWFLIRLVTALILGLADVILLAACTAAAIAFVFFGPTGQNLVYGVEAILVLLLAFAALNMS